MKRNRKRLLSIRAAILLMIIIVLAVFGYKVMQKQAYVWLPGYIEYTISKKDIEDIDKPVHILFMFVDHFEPKMGDVSDEIERRRTAEWIAQYRKMAQKHRDADGVLPQHCWFYPYDQIHPDNLLKLSALCYEGCGEIELHLHHSNDTDSSLTIKLLDALDQFGKVGALLTAESTPKHTYGFIHGNWALDNSRLENGRNYCGVNNELTVLAQTGCYADFTFPAFSGNAQPRKINSIYYAYDDPDENKSYNTGRDLQVGASNEHGFMIFEGPLALDWGDLRHVLYPVLENGEIEPYLMPTPRRADLWIETAIHVKGRPEWIFVKVFTHSAREKSRGVVCGKPMDDLHTYLEEKYNDGNNFILHYITAREGYNIAKAAEAGFSGDPNQYRDYLIKPYVNRNIRSDTFYTLTAYSTNKLKLEIADKNRLTHLQFRHPVLKEISGHISQIEYEKKISHKLSLEGNGPVKVTLFLADKHHSFRNAKIINMQAAPEGFLYTLSVMLRKNKEKQIEW